MKKLVGTFKFETHYHKYDDGSIECVSAKGEVNDTKDNVKQTLQFPHYIDLNNYLVDNNII